MVQSVTLALTARDAHWASPLRSPQTARPLVAASIGPYGAALADGSEYRGDYQVPRETLQTFHEGRWGVLANSGADLLACETIPSGLEADVLLDLMEAHESPGWLAFSCRDGQHISDGTPMEQVITRAAQCAQVVALGVNCTAPEYIEELIGVLKASTNKPIIVYPNFGGHYDPQSKVWEQSDPAIDWAVALAHWLDAGASIVGGCCGIGPAEIAPMRDALDRRQA